MAPPFDSTGSGNENESSKDGSEQTKTTTAASEPGLAAPSKYPIYGPFIASRDVVLLEEGPAPGMVVNPEDRDKAGRNRYEYVPTGLEGWYENGYGSNYHSACTLTDHMCCAGLDWIEGVLAWAAPSSLTAE